MRVYIGPYNAPRSSEEREEEVRIDGWDLWNLDQTLAKIIYPALVSFKEKLNTYPSDLTLEEWEANIDKMIFSFNQIATDDIYLTGKDENEIQEGLDLFAKYFRALWN